MDHVSRARCPHLWISYPWTSSEERDFAYLVSQLKDADIEATYNSTQLQPQTPLWQQIVPSLIGNHVAGLMCILTASCLTHRPCANEVVTALDQTLHYLGPEFPRIILLQGIAVQDLPPTLRLLPCCYLTDQDWKLRVADALNRGKVQNRGSVESTRFIWKIHSCYDGDPSATAIEVCSRFEPIQYWRIAIPKAVPPCRWGQGPSGGGEISRLKIAPVQGSGRYASYDVNWFGAANAISKTESAYAVFSGQLPEFVCFGPATTLKGPPAKMELFWIGSGMKERG
jgi:hypothetical protein